MLITPKTDNIALEIEIRGTIAHLFSTIENCLARIILITDRNDTEFQWSKLMLSKKLEKVISVLQKDYRDFYEHNKSVFESLVSLVEFRNQMIHCKFIWEDLTLQTFSIVDIQKNTDKTEDFIRLDFTLTEVNIKCQEILEAGNFLLPVTKRFQELFNHLISANPKANFPKKNQ